MAGPGLRSAPHLEQNEAQGLGESALGKKGLPRRQRRRRQTKRLPALRRAAPPALPAPARPALRRRTLTQTVPRPAPRSSPDVTFQPSDAKPGSRIPARSQQPAWLRRPCRRQRARVSPAWAGASLVTSAARSGKWRRVAVQDGRSLLWRSRVAHHARQAFVLLGNVVPRALMAARANC